MPEEEKKVTIEDLEKSSREIKQQEFLAQETPKEPQKVEEPAKVEAPAVVAETPAAPVEPTAEAQTTEEEPTAEIQAPPAEETPEQKAERLKAENRERSRAGREREQRLKLLEESQLKTNQLLEELVKQRQQPVTQTVQPEEFQIPVERQQFQSEVAQAVAKLEAEKEAQRKAQEMAQRKSYEDSYVLTLQGLKELEDDPTVYQEIFDAVTKDGSPFNKQHSWNAAADVAKNFKEAKAHVLKNRPKAQTIPLKNDKGVAPLGAGVTTTISTKQERPTELSPEGLEFLRKTGMSREWAEKVLAEK